MDKASDRSLFLGAVLLAALLVAGGFISSSQTRTLQKHSDWVIHTHQVLDVSGDLLARLLDAEVGMRGFVITGDEHFLEPYEAAHTALDGLLTALSDKTRDNAEQQERLERLQHLTATHLDLLKEGIAWRRTAPQAAQDFIATKKTRDQLKAIRDLMREIEDEEHRLLSRREQQAAHAYQFALGSLLLNVLLGLAGVGAFVLKIRRGIARRHRHTEALQALANELAKSNAELEQFAYVASHDLQEPLRAISGCVQILEKRYKARLDASATELIGHTVDGASRMQKLINDLLHYSRVATRGQTLALIDATTALQAALRNLEVAITESRATIQTVELPTVYADATQLTQLFQNLIGNAIKFAGGRPPVVQISVRREPSRWVFSVQDNGIGIAPEYYERIFGVFQRLHTRDEYPGTGIGLSICRKIVERHGGQIWVESAPEHGSTFFFTLSEKGTAS